MRQFRINLLQICCINEFSLLLHRMKRRNTATKQAVMAILTDSDRALSQEAIFNRLLIEADRATIYRILNRFCADNVLHKIIGDDGNFYFAINLICEKTRHNQNHFHFRCTSCEKIECLPDLIPLTVPSGYVMMNMNCMLSGLCKNCSYL